MPEQLVRTTLGICRVTLQREGMALEERGGFTAQWTDRRADERAEAEGDVLGLEDYRRVVKAYLADLYRDRYGREPSGVTLNLASHQLLDDLQGWTKLNWRPA